MITSIKNPHLQQVRALLAQRKAREQSGSLALEGVRLAEEALAAGLTPSLALYSSAISARGRELLERLDAQQTQIEEVQAEVLERISNTETSQGLIWVCPQPNTEVNGLGEPLLVLDQLRDPGNLGTILRSACAFGFTQVALTPGSVDVWSPKALRAGMGAQFKLQLANLDAAAIQQRCKSGAGASLRILLAVINSGQPGWHLDLKQPLCLVIGGEAFGPKAELRQMADEHVSIPMQTNNESLNAAMAASILMYETYRQRNLT